MDDPLDLYYVRRKREAPALRALAGASVPEPARRLLVHAGNMTPTLSAHCGGARIGLRVLDRAVERREGVGRVLTRWVLLLDAAGRPVEFGCIHIFLERLPEAAAREVLEERTPLGRLLEERQVPRESRPTLFFECDADDTLAKLLELPAGARPLLYGRKNTIVAPDGRAIAQVVEVLPPL